MAIKVKEGQGAVIEESNIGNKNSSIDGIFNSTNSISAYRVKSIILDNTHPRFKEAGEWNGLGTIEYDSVISPNPFPNNSWPLAKPISPNIKNYPLINEIVYIISLPNTDLFKKTSTTISYYSTTAINIWNHPHHNGYPENPNTPPPSQQKDYEKSILGSVRRVTDQSTEIFLGNTFKERSNIHPLLPFEGDIIEEGRWGNSIRFSSTIKTKSSPSTGLNNWSQGPNMSGDPITIIRNGQSIKANDKGWLPITENINDDLSSLYLTSTQTIPLTISSNNYLSYNTAPESVNKYSGAQLLINSGRIVLNTNQDHLLLSAIKSINLNAVNSVNIDTPTVIMQANAVYIGSKSATEPVLLGNSTINLLKQLTSNLKTFMDVCSILISAPAGAPLVPLNATAAQLSTTLELINQNLDNIASKSVKTV